MKSRQQHNWRKVSDEWKQKKMGEIVGETCQMKNHTQTIPRVILKRKKNKNLFREFLLLILRLGACALLPSRAFHHEGIHLIKSRHWLKHTHTHKQAGELSEEKWKCASYRGRKMYCSNFQVPLFPFFYFSFFFSLVVFIRFSGVRGFNRTSVHPLGRRERERTIYQKSANKMKKKKKTECSLKERAVNWEVGFYVSLVKHSVVCPFLPVQVYDSIEAYVLCAGWAV